MSVSVSFNSPSSQAPPKYNTPGSVEPLFRLILGDRPVPSLITGFAASGTIFVEFKDIKDRKVDIRHHGSR